jgi:hypothetical protein
MDGPVDSLEVHQAAAAAGIHMNRIFRIAHEAGARTRRVGGAANNGHWQWYLDPQRHNQLLKIYRPWPNTPNQHQPATATHQLA